MKDLIVWIKNHLKLTISCLILIVSLIFSLKTLLGKQSIAYSEPIKKGSIRECVYGIGTVTSNKTFQVKVGIPSKIHNIFVKEGSYVEKGDKLIELETLFCAPFSGTVTSITGAIGENAFPQTTLINLVDLKDYSISMTLDQVGAMRVQKGQKVRINFDGFRDTTFTGSIISIYPQGSHFIVRIETQGLPSQILPGMSADVAIEIAEHRGVILVPIHALEKNQVFVKRKEQKPYSLSLKIGLIDGIMAEVTSEGLQEGDLLLLQNKEKP